MHILQVSEGFATTHHDLHFLLQPVYTTRFSSHSENTIWVARITLRTGGSDGSSSSDQTSPANKQSAQIQVWHTPRSTQVTPPRTKILRI